MLRGEQAMKSLYSFLQIGLPILVLGSMLSSCGKSTATPTPEPVGMLTVNSTNDIDDGVCNSAHCSLREAILKANTLPGVIAIGFNIGGGGEQTIALTSSLPDVTASVSLDATTQPGYYGSPLIELDGSLAGDASGLVLRGENTTVKGFVINRFLRDGIRVLANHAIVQKNFIGTDISGSQAKGVSGNGIYSDGDLVLIGGETPGDGNLISGNSLSGVYIYQGLALVKGNWIGTSAGGMSAMGNTMGVRIRNCQTDVQVGGATPAARNIISGNATEGIYIFDAACPNKKVSIFGNYIGTNFSGTGAVGNMYGVHVVSSGVTIGAELDAMQNLISGNTADGIIIETSDTQVIGNRIGTEKTGHIALANGGNGVLLKSGATDNLIKSNVIGFNDGYGVAVLTGNGVGNKITDNSIHDNGLLGIAVDKEDVIPNDNQDPDGGANNRQNYPVLVSAISDQIAQKTTFQGTLNSAPGTSFTVEFFSNTGCDPSGYGEGQGLLITTSVLSNANGLAALNTDFPSALNVGTFITATATDPGGNTSEFSNCIPVTQSALPTVALIPLGTVSPTVTPNPTHLNPLLKITPTPTRTLYIRPKPILVTPTLTRPPHMGP
jgi:CSLREA domain-containing protein